MRAPHPRSEAVSARSANASLLSPPLYVSSIQVSEDRTLTLISVRQLPPNIKSWRTLWELVFDPRPGLGANTSPEIDLGWPSKPTPDTNQGNSIAQCYPQSQFTMMIASMQFIMIEGSITIIITMCNRFASRHFLKKDRATEVQLRGG